MHRAKLAGSAVALSVATALLAQGASAGMSRQPARVLPAAPLVFGVYPGGVAGTVGPSDQVVPDDAAKDLAALERLRIPGRPFVLHLYVSYTGPGSATAAEQVGAEIDRYTAAGFQSELVLAYRPADRRPDADVGGFVDFVRAAVHDLGANESLTALQITNEANVTNAPNAADGSYPGVRDALVQGVVAAKAEARRNGFDRLRIGFNWAFALDRSEAAFWTDIGKRGGEALRSAVDWVGLDVYPETWGPRAGGRDLAQQTANTMLEALTALRQRYMPLAGLGRRVSIHISENGYPTGSGRTEAMQAAVLRAAVTTVARHRRAFGISDYRWFDLRDANSSGRSFESRYGLLRDDYLPKPAFTVYRDAIAAYSSGRAP